MKSNEWDNGTSIEVERLGECTAYRRMVHGEYYQWKIKYFCVEVIGDYCYDNIQAFNNAIKELKKRFKTILN